MSAYKFTKPSEVEKAVEVSWTTNNDNIKSYLPPGQRKQTVAEAFPELTKNGLVNPKKDNESSPLTFAEKLKSSIEQISQETNKNETSNVVVEKNDFFVMPSRKTVVRTDNEIWKSRRLYPSSEEEDDKKALNEEPEDDYDSYDDVSENEHDDVEVYDPSEYDRH